MQFDQSSLSLATEADKERIIAQADEEIKQIKHFISEVYFKEDLDTHVKEKLLDDIQELECIKLDDDFYYHLESIYQEIVKRQEENLAEYQQSVKIINESRQKIEQSHKEIETVLTNRIECAINDYTSLIKVANEDLTRLESEIISSEQDIDNHLAQICEASNVVKEEFEQRLSAATEQKRQNSLSIESLREENEQIMKTIKHNVSIQDGLKNQIKDSAEKLQNLERKIEESLNPGEQIARQIAEEKRCTELQQIRDKLDEDINRIKVRLENCKLDNSIIEKRQMYFISQVSSDFVKDKQIDVLRTECQSAQEELTRLSVQYDAVRADTASIEAEIVQVRQKKAIRSQVNLFLSVVIAILLAYILYKFV